MIKILFFIFISCALQCHTKVCFSVSPNNLHYLCPLNYKEIGGFELTITPLKEVLISCDHLHSFKINELPNITLSKISLLQFKFCPLPESGFKEVLDWFSTQNVGVIEYEYAYPKNQTLTKRALKGLKRVRFLKLSNNRFKNIEEVFENTPSLFALELRANGLRELKPNMFKKLELLEWLDLGDNNLEDLSFGVFQSLKNLEYLRLFKNNLTVIHEYSFENLSRLKSLDLSSNNIETITENAFQNLKNLANLSLAANHLRTIPLNIVENNTKLQRILLNNNPHLQLVDYMFSNFPLLQEVDVSSCSLSEIPEHLFENSLEMRVVKMEDNLIQELSQNLFKNLTNIEEINLATNRIKTVKNLFTSLNKLKKLYLQNNIIETINENTFSDLVRLEELNLENNRISYIHVNTFSNNDLLRIINLSRNLYSGKNRIFKDLPYLEIVDLSHNSVSQIESVITFITKPMMESFDLRYNIIRNISLISLQGASDFSIYLDHNNITSVDFKDVELISGPYTSVVHLQHNPLNCDCHLYDLMKYFNGEASDKVVSMFNIRIEALTCKAPPSLKNTSLEALTVDRLTCPLQEIQTENEGCPEECMCTWRPSDESVIINCTNRNLTKFPKISTNDFMINFTEIEVNLTSNNLVAMNMSGYDNVTKLFLSYNKVRTVSVVPPHLKVLHLDHNQLTFLDGRILRFLAPLIELRLANNSWSCVCGTEEMSTFLRQNTKQVDFKHIYCSNSTTRLIDLTKKDLCIDIALISVISAISILLVLSTCAVFYYRYQEEIKIWLFARNCCLFWVSEEDLDKDKIFDAFISYSHDDENFVVGTLVPKLEEESYKLCLHYRDWMPGELISTHIINSVEKSKRTIIILSDSFLQSTWGRAEFQQAHAEAMAEGRARMIVVIYGEVDEEELDDVMRSYLRSHNYVKWGDKYFWDRLKYALPHKKIES